MLCTLAPQATHQVSNSAWLLHTKSRLRCFAEPGLLLLLPPPSAYSREKDSAARSGSASRRNTAVVWPCTTVCTASSGTPRTLPCCAGGGQDRSVETHTHTCACAWRLWMQLARTAQPARGSAQPRHPAAAMRPLRTLLESHSSSLSSCDSRNQWSLGLP
jgi:hypothetical protein